MKPKSFKRWCEDNGRKPSDPGSDRVWRTLYDEYRVETARVGIMALLSEPNPYCGPDCGFLKGLGDCTLWIDAMTDGGDDGTS